MAENINNSEKTTKRKISLLRLALGITALLVVVCLLGMVLYFTDIVNFAPKDFNVKISGSGIHIVSYTGSDKNVEIPDTINSRKVIAIDKKAFYNNQSVVKIILPESLKTVGNKAFANCKNLKEVTFNSEYTNFEENVFENCGVEAVALPSKLQKISNGMFKNCNKITKVSFPDNLKEIGEEAFYGCTSLDSMTIGESVYKIGEDAFGGNSADFTLSSMMGTETEDYALSNNISYIPCNSHYKPYNMYPLYLGANTYNTNTVSDVNTGILTFSPSESGCYRITLSTSSNNEITLEPTDDTTIQCSSIRGNTKDIICNYNSNSIYYLRILASEDFNYNVKAEKVSNKVMNLYKKGEQLLKGESSCKLTSGTELRENHNTNGEATATVSSDIILTKILDYYVDSKNRLWCKINANVGGHGNKNLWFAL